MHRFYIAPEDCRGEVLRLDDREGHHALRVLRLKPGDEAVALDGAGGEFFCRVETAARGSVSLRVTAKNFIPAPSCAITLLVGIPKGKIIENIIQKSVELGARRIVPLLTERVVTHLDDESAEPKREKWRLAAVEAVKQCGAAWLPEIEAPTAIPAFLARKEKFDLQLAGSLQKERRHPGDVFREYEKAHGASPKTASVWIGPEGDFTPAELETIRNAGAHAITLGKLTLRVETAAIYCLSILNYELNR
jgi:16S rRNA (uracil1498-N3)-methyltransferase